MLAQPRSPLQADPASAIAGPAPAIVGRPPAYLTERSILRTERLVLRPLAPDDRAPFLAAVRSALVDLNEFCPLHRLDESDEHLFERHLAMSAAAVTLGKAVRLVVTPAADPSRVIGAVNLNDIARGGLEARALINWWLVPEARRQGLACEAARAVLDHAFEDLPFGRSLHRVDGLIDPANFASLRLAGRLRMHPQPGMYERVMIHGEAKVHQLYSAFAGIAPLPASMIEFKPLPGLEAILTGSIRI